MQGSTMEWLRLSQLSLGPQLGRGAFCEVHLATLERTKEQVAIKRVRRDLRPGSQRDLAVRDLKTELDVLLQIEPHSHVVRLLGRGTDGDSTFVVLEVVPETFTQRWEAWKAMRHQFLPEPLASKVAWFFGASGCCGGCASRRRVVWRAQLGAGRDLASALAHLHRGNRGYKVLYRDLKPSNIGFDGDRLVLYDFGLAKIVPASPGGGKKTARGPLQADPRDGLDALHGAGGRQGRLLRRVRRRLLLRHPPLADPLPGDPLREEQPRDPSPPRRRRRPPPPHRPQVVRQHRTAPHLLLGTKPRRPPHRRRRSQPPRRRVTLPRRRPRPPRRLIDHLVSRVESLFYVLVSAFQGE
mmetsp:Transcript_28246/g.91057  ORF Transcript_28246/g.91057 Transcript_28246/m.91057 type:complete len:354 (+) Transcript_28246:121-1182(+)